MARKRHEEHENHERWLVSYADFITLLFAFFVVLYATSNQNEEKEKKFEESIRHELKISGGGGQTGGSPNTGNPPSLNDPIDLLQQKRIGNEDLQETIEKLIDKTMSDEEKKKTINSVRHDSVGVRVSLAASTFFPSGSTKLRLPALKSLDKVAEILKKSNRPVIIEGHTDSDQVMGGMFESNWELASLRATTVVRYLIKIHKMDGRQLSAISYADQRPVVANSSETNKSLNRRIELLIVNTD